MKRVVFIVFALLSFTTVKAQNVFYPSDSVYLFPGSLNFVHCGSSNFSYSGRDCQVGWMYSLTSGASDMYIYGVAISLISDINTNVKKYIYLYGARGSIWGGMDVAYLDSSEFDYSKICFLSIPKSNDVTHDTLIPFYHTFFRTPIHFYGGSFFATFGASRFESNHNGEAIFNNVAINSDELFKLIISYGTRANLIELGFYPFGQYNQVVGIFPIIDRNLWQPCRHVTRLRPYACLDRVTFFWDESYGSCNYELKWGLADDDTSNYQTYETTGTSAMFYGLERGREYACLVRSQCLCDDPQWGSVWGPWSDTVHFRRDRFVNAGSNNPDWGLVTGGGYYDMWDTATLEAFPLSWRSSFVSWSDNDTTNPRTIVVTDDLSLTAIFAFDSTGLEDSTGIAPVAQQRVSIVPNPATNSVTVSAESEILSVEAYNVKGQRIASAEGNGTILKLDTSAWQNGTYTITIRTVHGSVTRKLVIKK